MYRTTQPVVDVERAPVGGTVVLLVRHKLCKFPFINKVRKTNIHNSLQCKLPRGSCVEYFDFVVSINSALLGVT